MSTPTSCTSRDWLGRLWRHECERVYSDRLISDVEVKAFEDIILDGVKKNLGLDVSAICTSFFTCKPHVPVPLTQ